MANRKISDLTALTAPVTGDLLPIVDISEAAAADKNKKITYGTFLSSVPLGTAAAPSIAFTGDPNTGIYSPGADQLAISTNGTSRLSISSAGEVTTTNEKLNLITVGRGGGAVATNTVVGTGALAVNSTGARLTAVGNNAGTANTASDNAFLGYNTGAANTSGTNNTAVGAQALATNISGSNNTAVGYATLLVSTGSNNTGVGGGTFPLATLANNTTGGNNTAVGTSALSSNSTGSSNICFGKDSGSALTTGSNNTIIGSIAGTAGLGDTVIIGAGTTERLRIDSSGRLLVGGSPDSGGALLQVFGDRIRVGTAKTPASASDTGTAGEICWDASYIYVCTATNTWKRTAIATW
jgi:trimeric autotransporter adhesin